MYAGERPVTTVTVAPPKAAPANQPPVVHIDPEDLDSVDHHILARREQRRLEKQVMAEGSRKRKALAGAQGEPASGEGAGEVAKFHPEWNIRINEQITYSKGAEEIFLKCLPS